MTTLPLENWQTIATREQNRVLASIPHQWRIPDSIKSHYNGQAISFIEECNILKPKRIEITRLNATQLLAQIHSGRQSAEETCEAFCARAAVAHQLVNCLTDFFPEEAIAYARGLDEVFKGTGEVVGDLHGLPIAVKDIMNVKGKKTTMAWVAWADNPPSTFDASPVKIMRDAGAVIIGRTTMPQTGMALETVSNLWGRTLNAYNSAFGSGGSSGGDAVLCALRGVPAAPLTTDIGGSIRAPGAFNGLYAIRPTAARIPRHGLLAVAPGNNSIVVSAGPNCHSMEDLKLLTKQILTHPTLPYEPTTMLGFWTETPTPSRKLRVGIISTDGVVDPHPPVQRAILETWAKLEAAGHEVFEFPLPFDFWDAALTTWALYFQTGATEHKAIIASANEPTIAQFTHNMEVFKTKELTVPELFQHNTKQAAYKVAFQEAWDKAQVDCIICPSSPMAGVPHDFPVWWGYTTIWNLLVYPSIVVPVKDFKICAASDPKDIGYKARDNPFDQKNWDIYDPEAWATQPVSIQIVGRPCRDEGLIAVSELIGRAISLAGRAP